MRNLTLKQLRYVEALADRGHFGRAAADCSVTQPALSMQIKDLEDAFGLALFERGAGHVRLTGFGEQVLERARIILRSVDELGDLARAAQGALVGRLRLGVIPTIAPYMLPRVIGLLTQSYPQIDLNIREALTGRLLEDLSAGRLDFAILALPVSEPQLHEVPLHDEAFVLVRPEADAAKPVPDAAALARMQLLLLEEGHCFRDQALSFCSLRSPLAGEALEGSSLSTLVQMVGAGMGVTLIPEMAVGIETRSAPVAVSHFPAPAPKRSIGMVWRRANPLAPQLTEMAQIVGQAMAPVP